MPPTSRLFSCNVGTLTRPLRQAALTSRPYLSGVFLLLAVISFTAMPTSQAAALPAFDAIVDYLRWGLRSLFVIWILAALVLWLAGTAALVSARRGVAHTLAGGATSFGRATNVNPIVRRVLNPLRVAILALAGTTLLLLNRPSLASLIVILAITLLLLLVVQVLATPADATGTNVSSSSPNSSTEQP